MDINTESITLQENYKNKLLSNEEFELKCELLNINSTLVKNLTQFDIIINESHVHKVETYSILQEILKKEVEKENYSLIHSCAELYSCQEDDSGLIVDADYSARYECKQILASISSTYDSNFNNFDNFNSFFTECLLNDNALHILLLLDHYLYETIDTDYLSVDISGFEVNSVAKDANFIVEEYYLKHYLKYQKKKIFVFQLLIRLMNQKK